MNFDQARANMVEQQVRTWEVLDARVLEVLGRLPREDFVQPQYRKLAYADLMLPLAHEQFMMKPVVEGRVLQSLELSDGDSVLEIGTGSGYLAACLGALAGEVRSVELHEDLLKRAEQNVARLGLENVALEAGDALGDWDPGRAYDAVVVTGSARRVIERFRGWVKPGGRMFFVRGDAPVMEAVLLSRLRESVWSEESLFETDLPRLIGAEDPDELDFA